MRKLSASTIYRRAAQMIEKGLERFTCVAISRVITPGAERLNCLGDDTPAGLASKSMRDAYVALFEDDRNMNGLQYRIISNTYSVPERQGLRAMLLCMAAAVMGYRPRKRKVAQWPTT